MAQGEGNSSDFCAQLYCHPSNLRNCSHFGSAVTAEAGERICHAVDHQFGPTVPPQV